MIPISWLISAGALAAAFGAGFATEKHLRDAADDRRIAAEAIAERDRMYEAAATQRLEAQAGIEAATQLEAQRQFLEAANAKAAAATRRAMRQPMVCPQVLGDVVIPDSVVAGLRAVSGADRVPAANSAASEPDR